MSGTHIASTSSDSYTPVGLFAQDGGVQTKPFLFAANVELPANSIVALNASNQMVEWNPGGSGSVTIPVGITCEAVDTTGATAMHPVYVGGYFNTDALNWPAGVTAAQQLNAFIGTMINHRSLGYSG